MVCRPFFAGSRDAETKESRHAVAVIAPRDGERDEHVPPQRASLRLIRVTHFSEYASHSKSNTLNAKARGENLQPYRKELALS